MNDSSTSKVHRTSLTQPIDANMDEINDSEKKLDLFAYIDSMTVKNYWENKRQKPTRTPFVTLETNKSALRNTIKSSPWWYYVDETVLGTTASLALQAITESTSPQTEVTTTTQKTTTLNTVTSKTPVQFDIEKFLEIISNLTYDYYTNLTEQVNETFIRMSVPTCGTPTTTTELTTTPEPGIIDYSHFGNTVIGKCFVCGLEDVGIPYNAHCADAFAGDFIPLVPQDPRAKGHIARFRKYCRYKDVNNFLVNSTMPRSIFGRWTGGCSVRWTDLSGVYTQRSCRNRRQATTGRHFASKRMAKLEMTLSNMDNGCIISPVATLLPLSRGISLFARFHACVCTGNWCNRAVKLDSDSDKWMTSFIAFIIILRQIM